jgi:hypothetical protein
VAGHHRRGRTQYYGDNPGPELREQFQDDEVIVHEMGHVLGIGTLWNFGRQLLQGTIAGREKLIRPLAVVE